ncbi:YJEN3 protein, partial [Onychorhynchus coronatus]|nr:YJEN3 protein [Onychorhynchus coronatus]
SRVPQAFPLPSLPRKQPTVLVVCGPAQNGAIGLVCARHLRSFDYEPTIFYPKRSPDPLYRDFTTQCEKMDIPFLSYLPTEVSPASPPHSLPDSTEFIPPFSLPFPPRARSRLRWEPGDAMKSSGGCRGPASHRLWWDVPPGVTPSRCVPAGWDAEAGGSGGISPDVLVSLAAPKECARRFLGRQHFVAGRFLPYDVQKKFELNPPEYPGTECVVAL